MPERPVIMSILNLLTDPRIGVYVIAIFGMNLAFILEIILTIAGFPTWMAAAPPPGNPQDTRKKSKFLILMPLLLFLGLFGLSGFSAVLLLQDAGWPNTSLITAPVALAIAAPATYKLIRGIERYLPKP